MILVNVPSSIGNIDNDELVCFHLAAVEKIRSIVATVKRNPDPAYQHTPGNIK